MYELLVGIPPYFTPNRLKIIQIDIITEKNYFKIYKKL